MKKALIYLAAFALMQLAAGAIIPLLWQLVTGNDGGQTASSGPVLVTTMTVFSVVGIAVFLWRKWAEVSPRWMSTRPWMVFVWSTMAALGAIIPSVFLQEQMPQLPNYAEEGLQTIMNDRLGYVCVGLLAPFAEELVFRGAILRALLDWAKNHWTAIAISALLFAIIHFNPAQMPHAFIIGLLLGWMYYRTGSILPGVCYHWVNNSVAYVITRLYPDPDIQLIDILGTQQHVLMALAFSLCILIPALFQLHLWMKRAVTESL